MSVVATPAADASAAALHVLHDAVPGRIRLRVRGLARAEALARALESALPGRAGIRRASASPRTATLLLHFDRATGRSELLAAVGGALRELEHAGSAGRGGAARLAGRTQPRAAPLLRALAPLPRLVRARARQVRPGERAQPIAASGPPASAPEAWHLRDAAACVERFASCGERGLDPDVAVSRLAAFGPNALPRPQPRPALAILAEQVETLPVAMLAASAAVSLLTGGVADAIVIGGVVVLNALIGFVTESQSEQTIHRLAAAPPGDVLVIRGGEVRTVPTEHVVPGDLLVLAPGAAVAADARLLRARRLTVDESALTGESMPVAKSPARIEAADTPLRDRANMVYRGTFATGGGGVALVVASGADTEIGRIQRLVGDARPPETPSQAQLRQLGNQLVVGGGAVCAAMFAIGTLRGQGVLPMLRTAISLAVAALPEGLPTVATTTLALGVSDLRRRRVLVRHIDAIETLGSVQALCLDKTGTITWNRMTAMAACAGGVCLDARDERLALDGLDPAARLGFVRLLEACSLCSETELVERPGGLALEGTPTERALVALALGSDVDVARVRRRHPLVRIEHRSDEAPYMTSLHEAPDGRLRIAVKGNPSEVLALCGSIRRDDRVEPLGEADRSRIDAENGRMAGCALRVLGVAEGEADAPAGLPAPGSLTWLGLVGMADPPRPGIRPLLERLRRAGIEVSMITGDQSATAYAVAKEIALARDGNVEILDSADMERVPPDVLSALAQRVAVFSRVSPSHKLEIVQALQRAGRVVAMTGDGINDGPALKAADVGVAMGAGGSETARNVADVVLEQDDLGTLVEAVRRGRAIHENTRKAIHFLLSSNLSEILVMFAGVASGRGEPLSPMQLLWLNLITDIFPGLGLAVEPPDPDVLERPARDPHEPVLRRADFARIGTEGLLLAVGALGAWGSALRRHGPGPAAGTVAFMTLTSGQLLHALGSRSETRSLFDGRLGPMNWPLQAAVGGSLALQLATPILPGVARLLGLTRIGAADAVAIALGATLPLLAHEGFKKLGFWARDERPATTEGA